MAEKEGLELGFMKRLLAINSRISTFLVGARSGQRSRGLSCSAVIPVSIHFPIDTQTSKRNMLQNMTARQIKQRMKDYRTRLRQQGLRPVQIWVPDQRAPRFMEELERQVKNLSPQDEKETLDLLEQVGDWPEE